MGANMDHGISRANLRTWRRVLCALGVWLCVAGASAEDSAVDPRARDTLRQAITYLRSLPAFGIHADVTRDEVVHDDFRLQRTSTVDVTVKKPDRLRADVVGSQGTRQFFYNGKALSIYAKEENYFTSMSAARTLRETLDAAADKHDVELPLLDLVYVAAGGELDESITAAGVVGASTVDGVECQQLAFRGRVVDWQVWIERGPKPLLRKLVITTRDEPASPQYSATMRWDLAPKLGEELFVFSAPTGALPIVLARSENAHASPKKGK
jgi:hypothetical protein